jgi:hypothetical protein
MKLFNKDGELVCEAKPCKKPKFSNHRGRTWDCIEKIVDNKVIEWWFDSTWGRNMYFELNGKWYYTPIIREDCTDNLMIYKEELYTVVHQ